MTKTILTVFFWNTVYVLPLTPTISRQWKTKTHGEKDWCKCKSTCPTVSHSWP